MIIIIIIITESKSQKWIMSKMMVLFEIVLLAKNQPMAILGLMCVGGGGFFAHCHRMKLFLG